MLFFAVVLLCTYALPACGTTYYLSPSGNDANSGTSASAPWLSPYHALNCGDVILAAASSSYSYGHFGLGSWGPVTCASGNNVAWLKCAAFDACKISVPDGTHAFGMGVSASYWGVQGWEVSNLESDPNGLGCFTAQPANGSSPSIHHVIFANNVASTCSLAGFGGGKAAGGTSSIDYYVAIGNISYNAGTSNQGCGSGIGVLAPADSDTVPGTHIFVAGNFVYSTAGPGKCFDANGISLDSFDGRGEMPASYDQQAVVENNITVGNQGVGVRVQYNDSGNGPNHGPIYVVHNTMWGNSNSWNQYGSPDCGEFQMFKSVNTYVLLNLAATNQQGCYNDPDNPLAAYTVKQAYPSDFVMLNWGYSATGTNTQAINSPYYAFGPQNVLGVDPQYTNPSIPSAPNCGAFSSAAACMSGLVSNFVPKAAGASTFGYQQPSTVSSPDPFYPHWLCSVNLPDGLVTPSCS